MIDLMILYLFSKLGIFPRYKCVYSKLADTRKIIAALPVTSGSINLMVSQFVPKTIKLAINEICNSANLKRNGFI